MKRVRVAFLQKAPSGHANACLRALADTGEAELFVTMPPTLRDAPYDPASFAWLSNAYPLASLRRDNGLDDELAHFKPDVTLIVGWEQPAYRRSARRLRGSSFRVVGMDNQWLRTPKQVMGIASSRIYLRPYFDAAFLPGARQVDFALRLGFPRERIFEGFYSADVDAFRGVPSLDANDPDARKAFAYVGRLVESKGVNELVEAYEAYRTTVADPWKLLVLGTGPLGESLAGRPGIQLVGFVESARLPSYLAQASFLVLPSRFEPWGVVVHEATAAGLGCICASPVGSADAFVRNGSNGRIVKTGSASELADALRWAHQLSAASRADVSELSRSLASRITPATWAATVLSMSRTAKG